MPHRLLALAITVVVGVVLFVSLGKDPVAGLSMFFVEPLKNGYGLAELSLKAVPLTLIALGLAVCYRSNVWNIGAEGPVHRRRARRWLRGDAGRPAPGVHGGAGSWR